MYTERARAASRGIVEPVARGAARLGLTPNMLTLGGFLLHIPVAWLLARGHLHWGALALAAAAAFDALDGTLARLSGTVSAGGAFLDSSFDRMSEILVFLGLLAFALREDDGVIAMLVFVALAGSVMVSYTRARSEALDCPTKAGLFGRFERMLVLVIGLALGLVMPALIVVAAGAWLTAALRIRDAYAQGKGQRLP